MKMNETFFAYIGLCLDIAGVQFPEPLQMQENVNNHIYGLTHRGPPICPTGSEPVEGQFHGY